MSKKKLKTFYLFLDLETTDTNFDKHGNEKENKILEIAFLLTDRNLNKILEDNYVINHSQEDLEKYLSYSVKELHSNNNLLNEVLKSEFSLEYVDNFITYLLEENTPENSKIILVGNTISFDQEAIRRHMPSLYKMLDYKTIDISGIRECIAIIGSPFIKKTLEKKQYKHRAMQDVKESFYELEEYLKLLETLAVD